MHARTHGSFWPLTLLVALLALAATAITAHGQSFQTIILDSPNGLDNGEGTGISRDGVVAGLEIVDGVPVQGGVDAVAVVAQQRAGNVQGVASLRVRFLAGPGDDVLSGSAGRDTLEGGSGRDRVRGGAGNDELHGGRDRDFLDGGAGRNRIYGGDPKDSVNLDAEYMDQTNIADIQKSAVEAGKKHVILMIFDGLGWESFAGAIAALDPCRLVEHPSRIPWPVPLAREGHRYPAWPIPLPVWRIGCAPPP